MDKIKFTRVRDVKVPIRDTPRSAGIDFYIPHFNDELITDIKEKNNYDVHYDENSNGRFIKLHPHDRILIPSGIHVKFPDNHVLVAFNKSGVSSKYGLDVLAGVVDQDFEGEVHLSILNTSTLDVELYEDMKLIQFILLPIKYYDLEKIDVVSELYKDSKSLRGAGGFGSTGV